jgi:hypothetical protein
MRTLLRRHRLPDGAGGPGTWPADAAAMLRLPIDHVLVREDVALGAVETLRRGVRDPTILGASRAPISSCPERFERALDRRESTGLALDRRPAGTLQPSTGAPCFNPSTPRPRPIRVPPGSPDLRAEMRTRVWTCSSSRAPTGSRGIRGASDERLAWLTGFTGSAGFAAILDDKAGLFVDGRYRVQVRAQSDMGTFTPVDWPETKLEDWLIERCRAAARWPTTPGCTPGPRSRG